MKHITSKSAALLTAAFLTFTSNASFALNIGQPLPDVSIGSKGEITIEKEEHTYKPWSSTQLTGKIRTIQHIAGRTSAKKINQPFIDAIKDAQLDKEQYQTTTIINLNDALFGTNTIVTKKAEKKKSEFPWSSIVLDNDGSALASWGLSSQNSAIIILDKSGKVIFFKEGALSEEEITSTIDLIKKKTS